MAKAKAQTKSFKWKAKELKVFWYWINERHTIYLKKKAGEEWPWTKDKILRTFKFTNPFRQNDRVTQSWTNAFIRVLYRGKQMTDGDLLFQCAMFRLFNWPETYAALKFGMRNDWNLKEAIAILNAKRKTDEPQIFTGAYIIPTGGRSDPKIEVICEALDFLYDGRTKKQIEKGVKPNRHTFAKEMTTDPITMEKCVGILMRVPTIGPFIAYEIACDLRHTRLLHDAIDINSWANPGPGAKRGIHRLLSGKHAWKGKRPDYFKAMRQLLVEAPEHMSNAVKSAEWPFEMREIEHSLCEFDKYQRVTRKEGKTRSKYFPKLHGSVPWDKDASI